MPTDEMTEMIEAVAEDVQDRLSNQIAFNEIAMYKEINRFYRTTIKDLGITATIETETEPDDPNTPRAFVEFRVTILLRNEMFHVILASAEFDKSSVDDSTIGRELADSTVAAVRRLRVIEAEIEKNDRMVLLRK